MKTLKSLAYAAVFFMIGVAFLALVMWEWQNGIAAGSYGGATFADAPGFAAFVLAMQAAMGVMSLMNAVAHLPANSERNKVCGDENSPVTDMFQALHAFVAAGVAGIVCLIAIWAAWDLARVILHVITTGSDDVFSRVVVGLSLCGSAGVFIYLLFAMLIQPLYRHWEPRVRAAAAFLRNRNRS